MCFDLDKLLNCAGHLVAEDGFVMTDAELRAQLRKLGFAVDVERVRIDRQEFNDYFYKWRARVAGHDRPERYASQRFQGALNEYCGNLLMPGAEKPERFSISSLVRETDAAVHLCAQLGQPCGVVGNPLDEPAELQALVRSMVSILCVPSCSVSVPEALSTAEAAFRLAELIGRPVKRWKVYAATPLHFGGESVSIALKFAPRFDEIVVTGMPALGCNVPIDVQSAIAVSWAECMGGALMLERMTGKPCDFMIQLHPFDVWDINFVYGTPETQLLSEIAQSFNAALRGKPVSAGRGNIHVMAKCPGVQAAAEKAMMIALGAARGARYYQGMGALSLDEVYSPVELVIDSELMGMFERYTDGWPTDARGVDDMLASVRSGLNSGYMSTDETLDKYCEVLWHSRLFTRKSLAAYQDIGEAEALQRAEHLACNRLKGGPMYRPDAALWAEAVDIYANAFKNVTGTVWVNKWLV